MKNSTIAAIRFGSGLGRQAGPGDAQQVHDALGLPDTMRAAYPMLSPEEALDLRLRFNSTRRAEHDGVAGAIEAHAAVRRELNDLSRTILRHVVARQLDSPAPLRERLNLFWLDHFTTRIRNMSSTAEAASYIDTALRDTMTGRFADMLRAVIVHPQMLLYLDQPSSIGPNSRIGLRQGRGLNENLARELLELHTLGVGAGYTQGDVRQMAELLTGLNYAAGRGGFGFRPEFAEPGAETVLGRSYGSDGHARLDDILSMLDDLSVHPDTARHMAGKLATHFVSDTPDPALVAHIEARWLATGGDLMQVYAALLEHPAAWVPLGGKVKQPLGFITSAFRALGLDGAAALGLQRQPWQEFVANALVAMGQPFLRPPGPDGWDEAAEAWITPLGLSTRIRWAMRTPGRMIRPLPDPRELVGQALDDAASPGLVFAAGAADTVEQGVGLILASPEFNRR